MPQTTDLPNISSPMQTQPTETPRYPGAEQPIVDEPKSTNYGRLFLTTIGIAVLILCGALWLRFSAQPAVQTIEDGPATVELDTAQPAHEQLPSKAVFSGSLQKLEKDLHLFVTTKEDAASGQVGAGTYYEAGTFLSGAYQGYTRIVAIPDSGGAMGPTIFILATKDYQTYVLDDPDGAVEKYPEDSWDYPYHYLDQSKISAVAVFDTEQPQELVLDQTYSLFRESIPFTGVKTDQLNQWGDQISISVLQTDFSEYQKLNSPYANLSIFFKPYEQNSEYYDKLSDAEKQAFATRNEYFAGSTEVVVVDSTGLPWRYAQTTHQAVEKYLTDQASYLQRYQQYQNSKDANGETTMEYPQSPQQPGMGFQRSQVQLQTEQSLFATYEVAIPDACAGTSNTRVMNVSESQLEEVGAVRGQTVYKLKDSQSPLYKLQYDIKFGYYDQQQEFWKSENEGKSYKTLPEYVAQHPLLFVKDYWNRWVAVGEYDYLMPGGCGKPVVYLYPTEPTAVKVSLLAPTHLTTDIPNYREGWNVLAHPDGSLLDLQPDATDCGQFSSAQVGAEYAAAACATQTYPYLYWAGSVTSTEYPRLTEGWVVGRNELHQFFDDKLKAMGFDSRETADFKAYWVPQLQGKNAPYFRISFFQTDQVNQLFPMGVTPQPDTVFRMFLDYTALQSQPQQLPQPQQLQKLHRSGFTLVEWGGLKQ